MAKHIRVRIVSDKACSASPTDRGLVYYEADQLYDLDPAIAVAFIKRGWAEPLEPVTPDQEPARIPSRLTSVGRAVDSLGAFQPKADMTATASIPMGVIPPKEEPATAQPQASPQALPGGEAEAGGMKPAAQRRKPRKADAGELKGPPAGDPAA